jgi:hypothetical protein
MKESGARIVRLVSAWTVVFVSGAAGMWLWSAVVNRDRFGPLLYTLSALAFAGIGVLVGVAISRAFLRPNEFQQFVQAPPDER